MRFATVGTGGIGGFLGVKLASIGHEWVALARGEHLARIRKNGLVLDAPDGKIVGKPVLATDHLNEAGEVDFVFLGVKGDDLDDIASSLGAIIGQSTLIMPFLNGVEASDRLAERLSPSNVGNGVAYVSTTISEPGVVKQTGTFNRFIMAERDNRNSQRIQTLRNVVRDAGLNAPDTDDIEREVWTKFVLFSAMSGITAAARCTFGDIKKYQPLGDLFRGVIAETAALARERNVAIPVGLEDEIWLQAQNFPDEMRASTAVDLERGKPIEVEWISGAVVRLAREAGLAAPLNSTLYALLSPYRNGLPAADARR